MKDFEKIIFKMIRDNLKQYIPQLEYREFEKCAHAPWIEKYAKGEIKI